jgi:hypothetical protein
MATAPGWGWVVGVRGVGGGGWGRPGTGWVDGVGSGAG